MKTARDKDIISNSLLKRFTVPNISRFLPHQDSLDTTSPRLLLTFSISFPATEEKVRFAICSVLSFALRPWRCFGCWGYFVSKYTVGDSEISLQFAEEISTFSKKKVQSAPLVKGSRPASLNRRCWICLPCKKMSGRKTIHQLKEGYSTQQGNFCTAVATSPKSTSVGPLTLLRFNGTSSSNYNRIRVSAESYPSRRSVLPTSQAIRKQPMI